MIQIIKKISAESSKNSYLLISCHTTYFVLTVISTVFMCCAVTIFF